MIDAPCPSRKLVFSSRRNARAHMKRSPHGEDGKRPYKCHLCGHWHIGHQHWKKGKRKG